MSGANVNGTICAATESVKGSRGTKFPTNESADGSQEGVKIDWRGVASGWDLHVGKGTALHAVPGHSSMLQPDVASAISSCSYTSQEGSYVTGDEP